MPRARKKTTRAERGVGTPLRDGQMTNWDAMIDHEFSTAFWRQRECLCETCYTRGGCRARVFEPGSSGFLAPAGVSLRNMLAWTRRKPGKSRILVRIGMVWRGGGFLRVRSEARAEAFVDGEAVRERSGREREKAGFWLVVIFYTTRPRCATGNDDVQEAQCLGRGEKKRHVRSEARAGAGRRGHPAARRPNDKPGSDN